MRELVWCVRDVWKGRVDRNGHKTTGLAITSDCDEDQEDGFKSAEVFNVGDGHKPAG